MVMLLLLFSSSSSLVESIQRQASSGFMSGRAKKNLNQPPSGLLQRHHLAQAAHSPAANNNNNSNQEELIANEDIKVGRALGFAARRKKRRLGRAAPGLPRRAAKAHHLSAAKISPRSLAGLILQLITALGLFVAAHAYSAPKTTRPRSGE